MGFLPHQDSFWVDAQNFPGSHNGAPGDAILIGSQLKVFGGNAIRGHRHADKVSGFGQGAPLIIHRREGEGVWHRFPDELCHISIL